MLFTDKLNEIHNEIQPEFDRFFNSILANQNHSGDLLLVHQNGFYDEVFRDPYKIGPNYEGLSSNTHFFFIDDFRKSAIYDKPFSDFIKDIETHNENSASLKKFEEFSIHLETLVYLKIWEADTFIKRFYQLVRLYKSEPYDWHLKIAESKRDKDHKKTRQKLIRLEIRDQLQSDFPKIYNAFKTAYLTQIRNSIAHSKFAFLNRTILLNNRVESDPSHQLHDISFDDWINKFHHTLIIHNELLRLINKIQHHYVSQASEIEIQINKPNGTIEARNISYVEAGDRWVYSNNL